MSAVNTPASEVTSLYFDAPDTHFPMSSQETDSAPQKSDEPQSSPPYVHSADTTQQPVDTVATDVKAQDIAPADETPKEPNSVVMHPNGSSGWLPTTGEPTVPTQHAHKGSILKKRRDPSPASSLKGGSMYGSNTNGHERAMSVNSAISKRSTFTNVDGLPVSGSTFINGAGTTGPSATAEADESLHTRTASADTSLTPKQKSKIVKSEAKHGRSLSKIIKRESKVEKMALGTAIKELAELQKIQKTAVKREAKAHTTHAKTLSVFQKHEAAFLAAKAKYEASQAQLDSEAQTLDVCRSNAREATESMQEKSQEVDSLMKLYDVDEREREVKLVELNGTKSRSLWR